MNSVLKEVDVIKKDPNVQAWTVHLLRLRSGLLDEYVRDRGSFEDYISTILVESRDPQLAEIIFMQALRDTVQSWVPSALDRPSEVAMFVDLISAYMPENGYIKLFLKLQDQVQMGLLQDIDDAFDLAYGRDLRRKILNTLDSYFPVDLPRRNIGYKQFTSILVSHLTLKGYAGHAVRLLMRRGELSLNDRIVSSILESDASAVGNLLSSILEYSSPPLLEKGVRLLHEYSLRLGDRVFGAYRSAIEALDGVLDMTAEIPYIVFPGKGEILLKVSSNVVSSGRFFDLRWGCARDNWSAKLSEVRKEAEKERSLGAL